MESQIIQAKKSLFSHADPSLAIREMKTMTSHLHQTRDLLHQSLDLMGNIKVGVANTSSNLYRTSAMYDDYEGQLKKADLYVKGLKKKEEENERRIKMAFWFLVGVVIFVFIRRILFPGFYRGLFA
jgi:hypothetical protein